MTAPNRAHADPDAATCALVECYRVLIAAARRAANTDHEEAARGWTPRTADAERPTDSPSTGHPAPDSTACGRTS